MGWVMASGAYGRGAVSKEDLQVEILYQITTSGDPCLLLNDREYSLAPGMWRLA